MQNICLFRYIDCLFLGVPWKFKQVSGKTLIRVSCCCMLTRRFDLIDCSFCVRPDGLVTCLHIRFCICRPVHKPIWPHSREDNSQVLGGIAACWYSYNNQEAPAPSSPALTGDPIATIAELMHHIWQLLRHVVCVRAYHELLNCMLQESIAHYVCHLTKPAEHK